MDTTHATAGADALPHPRRPRLKSRSYSQAARDLRRELGQELPQD